MDKNEIFTLWISDNDERTIPQLAHLSLKSMLLCGYRVILYTYDYLDNVPQGVCIKDANEILDSSKIFRYKQGFKTYSGFANLFRYKRLWELGGTWIDLDVLLIKRLPNDKVLICSQTQENVYSSPNNAILRFPPENPFVNAMLNFAEKRGSDITHGETGPLLVRKMLNESFPDYNKFLLHFNFSNIVNWNDIDDYEKSPNYILNNINRGEIYGFHLFNTFFKKRSTEFPQDSLFSSLKECILKSQNREEYYNNLKKYGITYEINYNNIITNDIKYLSILADNSLEDNFKYSFLIDSNNLKKIEIYNIIRSISDSYGSNMGYENFSNDIKIIIFGKTDIGKDNIKLKENIMVFVSNYNEIKHYIMHHINSEYIIPINRAVIFKNKFFKKARNVSDIECHILNKNGDSINVFNYDTFKLCSFILDDIFNLNKDTFNNADFKLDILDEHLIHDYSQRSSKDLKLISLIDSCNPNSFLNVKKELLNFKFENLIQNVSYNHYTKYKNIISSNSYDEYLLKENNVRLNCQNAFYLNRINPKYDF